MPSPFKTKEVTPVQKLAYYWTRLDDQTKGYFEQLYKKYPQDVSEVLAGEALLPAPNCPTLQDWVDGKGGGEALSFSDFEHVYIQIEELKSEPEQVDAGEKFKVVWTGEAKSDFPAREDTLVFMDIRSSEEVRTLTLTYPEIKAGAVKEEIDCGPLPDGSYMATLTVNVDGSEHGSELTAQGIRNVAQVDVHVGESEEAFRARLAPVIVAIQRQANTAFMGDSGAENWARRPPRPSRIWPGWLPTSIGPDASRQRVRVPRWRAPSTTEPRTCLSSTRSWTTLGRRGARFATGSRE